jgi:phosphatidylserine/phosphatidylglycerophosphate/cardiolipin synthase-like enzyme
VTKTFPNGEKYSGQWKNGLPHGYGTYVYSDRSVFQGSFENGKENGKGVLISATDGRKYCVVWKNGVLQSIGPENSSAVRSSDETAVVESDDDKQKKEILCDGRMVKAWCSWCFQFAYHGRVGLAFFRPHYKCCHCGRHTIHCVYSSCNAMARSAEKWYNETCLKHKGVINQWSHSSERHCSQPAWCSWCFTLSSHILIRPRPLKRDVYQCNNCGADTVRCMSCSIAFARTGKYFNDFNCFKCSNKIEQWEKVEDNKAKYKDELPIKVTPFTPYTPIRTNIDARWYVDGRDAFRAMANAIKGAKSHVYMSFWIMVPTIYVFRDTPERKVENRLDYLIQKKAKEGVKFFVLLWDETNLFMGNMSKMNKKYLESLHPENVKVMRHPQMRPLQWSHHQKFVVIDDRHAFVGGVDFSTGRYDWHEHLCIDPQGRYWWGIDFYAPHVKKADQTTDPDQFVVDSKTNTRMPWHDIQAYVNELAARDVAYNFVQRWNHHKQTTPKYASKKKYPLLSVEDMTFYELYDTRGGRIDDTAKSIDNHNETKISSEIFAAASIKSASFSSPLPNATTTKEKENSASHTNVSNVTSEQEESRVAETKQEEIVTERLDTSSVKKTSQSNKKRRHRNKKRTKKKKADGTQMNTVTVQCIRSLCEWSGGKRTEASILGAYLEAIRNAQHFVYIENQFFISSTAGGGVENQICQALVERISSAYAKRETFRVVVLLTQPEDLSERVVPLVQYEYYTINRRPSSMIAQLVSRHPEIETNIEDYLSFYQLRSYGYLNDVPVTEQVFVHSKIMIVDDRIAIIASANFNDRSFLGTRDSEFGIVVLDDEMEVKSQMNGQPFLATRFAHSLRTHLFIEHLGLDFSDPNHVALVQDPVEASFFHSVWKKRAEENTAIFEKVFWAIPRNEFTTYAAYEEAKKKCPPHRTIPANHRDLLKGIKGLLTKFPLRFLSEEKNKIWENFIDDTIYQ